MITAEKALHIVLASAHPLKAVRMGLDEALGRCLAQDIRADRDMPPADRSAMDGYALRARDVSSRGSVLRLVGEVAAGSPKRPKVSPGTCVSILTGASVPPGADAVVKVEQTRESDGVVKFLATTRVGANIRLRGEEVAKGCVVLARGSVLDAPQIGLCASVGKPVVKVHSPPRVAVLCTGEELKGAHERVRSHQLRNSNGPALVAALAGAGIAAAERIVPDDPDVLAATLKQAAGDHDVVILTGGVSVGKYDYVPRAVRQIRATIHFHGVAMKPGRPQLYATLGRNRHIFGLPGNPLSVLTGFHELVLPALRRMSGMAREYCHRALKLPLARAVRCKGDRATFILGKLITTSAGLRVTPLESRGSADLVSAAGADGMLMVPHGTRTIPAGRLVGFSPWRAIL